MHPHSLLPPLNVGATKSSSWNHSRAVTANHVVVTTQHQRYRNHPQNERLIHSINTLSYQNNLSVHPLNIPYPHLLLPSIPTFTTLGMGSHPRVVKLLVTLSLGSPHDTGFLGQALRLCVTDCGSVVTTPSSQSQPSSTQMHTNPSVKTPSSSSGTGSGLGSIASKIYGSSSALGVGLNGHHHHDINHINNHIMVAQDKLYQQALWSLDGVLHMDYSNKSSSRSSLGPDANVGVSPGHSANPSPGHRATSGSSPSPSPGSDASTVRSDLVMKTVFDWVNSSLISLHHNHNKSTTSTASSSSGGSSSSRNTGTSAGTGAGIGIDSRSSDEVEEEGDWEGDETRFDIDVDDYERDFGQAFRRQKWNPFAVKYAWFDSSEDGDMLKDKGMGTGMEGSMSRTSLSLTTTNGTTNRHTSANGHDRNGEVPSDDHVHSSSLSLDERRSIARFVLAALQHWEYEPLYPRRLVTSFFD